MSKNKDNSNKFVYVIAILGMVFVVLLVMIITGLIKGHTYKPTETKTLAWELAKGQYGEVMTGIYRDKSRNIRKVDTQDYYKYEGVAEYYRNAVYYYAFENEDPVRAGVYLANMDAAKLKMKDLDFAAEEMNDKIKGVLERAQKAMLNKEDGE